MSLTDRRRGYRYAGVLLSEDGREPQQNGHRYRECAFPARAERRFRVWLVVVLLGIFPGLPLLAALRSEGIEVNAGGDSG